MIEAEFSIVERNNGGRRRPCCRRFKNFRIYLKILASSNSRKIRDVQERACPFTGEIIPVYRRDYTRLQERLYPSTGEIIPVYRRDYTRLQGSPFPIIPIYRKHLSICNLKRYWEIHAF
jgi:hypothetical protein